MPLKLTFNAVLIAVSVGALAGCGSEKQPEQAQPPVVKMGDEMSDQERALDSAFRELEKRARAGDADAQYKMGLIHQGADPETINEMLGQPVTNSDKTSMLPSFAHKLTLSDATAWLEKAAVQNHADAQFRLGMAYRNGAGVQKDLPRAFKLIELSAASGDAEAIRMLGVAYFFGEGVTKDAKRACRLWEEAAKKKNADAITSLGACYFYGYGDKKNEKKAFELWQAAANMGNAYAHYNLGNAFAFGHGVKRDISRAVEHYTTAAESHAGAQLRLGDLYRSGEGVPKNDRKAFELWSKAATQGDEQGQAELGKAYLNGWGTEVDRVLAYAWLNLASASASRMPYGWEEERDRIALTSNELAEAQSLSSAWKMGQTIVRQHGKASENNQSGPIKSKGTSTLSQAATASGFYVSASGHAVTNHHVIDECGEVRIEGLQGVAKIVVVDSANDLALLKVDGGNSKHALIASEPEKLRQGEDIIVFGYPLSFMLSSGGNLTPGIVSAKAGLGNNTSQIQITASIQPGSSGSPVMNNKGEVVGVVAMKLSDTKMARATGSVGQNVNFAVSGLTLKTFLDTHKIKYKTGGFFSREKATADLADEARQWTIAVQCWK